MSAAWRLVDHADHVDSYDPTVGVRITSLPATAEKVYTAIKAKRAQESRLITAG